MRGFVLAVVFFVAACGGLGPAPETPRESLAAAELAFEAAVDQAAEMRALGQIDDAAYRRIDSVITAGDDALGAAHAALGRGEGVEDHLKIVLSLTRALRRAFADRGG